VQSFDWLNSLHENTWLDKNSLSKLSDWLNFQPEQPDWLNSQHEKIWLNETWRSKSSDCLNLQHLKSWLIETQISKISDWPFIFDPFLSPCFFWPLQTDTHTHKLILVHMTLPSVEGICQFTTSIKNIPKNKFYTPIWLWFFLVFV
jgi:hypothetical protein